MSNTVTNQESSVKNEHPTTQGEMLPINKFSSQVKDRGSILQFEGVSKSNRQISNNSNAPQRRNLMRQGLNKPQPSQSYMQSNGADTNDLTAKGRGTQSIPIITFTNMNPDLNRAGNPQVRKFDNQQNAGGIIISQDTDKVRNPASGDTSNFPLENLMFYKPPSQGAKAQRTSKVPNFGAGQSRNLKNSLHSNFTQLPEGNKKDVSPYREFVLNKTQDIKSSIKLSNQMNSDMMLKKYSKQVQERNLDQLKMRQNSNQMDSNALQIQYQAMLMVNKSVLNTQQQQQQYQNSQVKIETNAQDWKNEDDTKVQQSTSPQPLILKQALIQRQQTFSHNNTQQRNSKSPGLVQNLMIDQKNDRKLQQIHNIYLNAGPSSHSQNISSHNSNNQINKGAASNDYPHFQSQKIQNTSEGKAQSQERSYLQLKRKVKPSTAGNPSSASKQYAQAQQHINGLPYPQAAAILSNTFLPYDNNSKTRSKSPAKFINGQKIQQSHTPQTNMSMIRIDEYSLNHLQHQKAISSGTTLQQNSTSSLPLHYHNKFNPKSSSQQIAENLFGRKKYSLQPQSIGQINPFSQNKPQANNDSNKNAQEKSLVQSEMINPASLYNPSQIRMHSNSTKIKISRNKQLLNKTTLLPQSQLEKDSLGGQQLINKNLRGKFVDMSPHSSKTQNVSMIVASAKKDLEDTKHAHTRGEIKRGSYPKQEDHFQTQNQINSNFDDNYYNSKDQKLNNSIYYGIQIEMPSNQTQSKENDDDEEIEAQQKKRYTIFEQSSAPARQKPSLEHLKLGNKEDARIKMKQLLERQKADASQKISEYVQQTQILRQDMRDSKGNAKNRYDLSSNEHSSEEIEHLEILDEAEDKNANLQAQYKQTNNLFDISQGINFQPEDNQENFRSNAVDQEIFSQNLDITPSSFANHPTDDFSEIENPEKTEFKDNSHYQTDQIIAMTQNNQVSEFVIEHELQEGSSNFSDAATRKHQLQNLIVEEMQPLYYFNVKPKLLESTSYEDSNGFNNFLQGTNTQESPYQSSMAYGFLNHKQNGLKEASTPFFIGSPVNNQTNFLESMRRMSQDSQQENSLATFGGAITNKGETQMTLHVRISQPRQNIMTFDNMQYESFGGSQRSLNDSPQQ